MLRRSYSLQARVAARMPLPLRPLPFGAEVSGVDLKMNPLSDQLAQDIRDAVTE